MEQKDLNKFTWILIQIIWNNKKSSFHKRIMLIKIYIQKYYHLQSSNKKTRKIKNRKNQKE